MKLVTIESLDHEVMSETSVKLTCNDHGQHALTSDVTLTVRVLDVNDNAPRFDSASYRARVVENSFIDTFVIRVHATDDDGGDNGLIHYILGNSPRNKHSTEPGTEKPRTADYDRRSTDTERRQKDGKRRYGGDGRRRGRRQRNSRPTATAEKLEHANIYNSRTEERRKYETEVKRSLATTEGDCVGSVNVDKDSGVVTVVGLIDFEYSAVISCRILAIDSGSPPNTGERPLQHSRWWLQLRFCFASTTVRLLIIGH